GRWSGRAKTGVPADPPGQRRRRLPLRTSGRSLPLAGAAGRPGDDRLGERPESAHGRLSRAAPGTRADSAQTRVAVELQPHGGALARGGAAVVRRELRTRATTRPLHAEEPTR